MKLSWDNVLRGQKVRLAIHTPPVICTRDLGKGFRIGTRFKGTWGHAQTSDPSSPDKVRSEVLVATKPWAWEMLWQLSIPQRKANAVHLDQAFILMLLFVSEMPVRGWSPNYSTLICSKAYWQEQHSDDRATALSVLDNSLSTKDGKSAWDVNIKPIVYDLNMNLSSLL